MRSRSAHAVTPTGGLAWPEVVFPTNLPETDGEPLDSAWHRDAINLLLAVIWFFFRNRRDFYAGGNMFIHYSAEQLRNQDFLGPDFFFVWGAQRDPMRKYWAVWEEGGRYPNVIIELLSPTTQKEDRTQKKRIYEQLFRTPEYFLYDPDTQQLEGWHLTNAHYEPMEQDDRGWIWSRQLELYMGTWEGAYQERHAIWLRFYDVHGKLVLTGEESEHERATKAQKRAQKEQRRAEDEKRRADAAEKELARLRARLRKLEGDS